MTLIKIKIGVWGGPVLLPLDLHLDHIVHLPDPLQHALLATPLADLLDLFSHSLCGSQPLLCHNHFAHPVIDGCTQLCDAVPDRAAHVLHNGRDIPKRDAAVERRGDNTLARALLLEAAALEERQGAHRIRMRGHLVHEARSIGDVPNRDDAGSGRDPRAGPKARVRRAGGEERGAVGRQRQSFDAAASAIVFERSNKGPCASALSDIERSTFVVT